jgi:hypothetical protein
MITGNLLSGNYLVTDGYLEVKTTGIIPNLISTKGLTLPYQTSFCSFGTTQTFGTRLQFSLSFANPEELRKHYNSQYWTFYTGSTSTGPFLEFSGPYKHQYQSTGILISSGSFLPGKIPGTNFFGKALIKPLTILDRIEKLENSGSLALNYGQKIGIGLPSHQALEKLHIGNGNLQVDGLIKAVDGIRSEGDIETVGNITANIINAQGLNIPGFVGGGSSQNDTSQIQSLISFGTGNAIHPKNVLGVSKGSAILGGAFNIISGKNSAQIRNHLIINGAGNVVLNDKTNRPSERVSIINGIGNFVVSSSDSLLCGSSNVLFPFTSGVVCFGDNSSFGAGEGTIFKTGVKGVFAFGDKISSYDDNNVVFNDNRGFRLSTIDKNTFIINHLNGIKTQGGGLNFLDNSHQTIYDYWLNDLSGVVPVGWSPYIDSTVNLYGPTAYKENGIQSFLWYMFGTNSGSNRTYGTNVPDLNLIGELRDAYGDYVTGLVINSSDSFPINIGLNNKTYNAVVTAAYPGGDYDLYGNLAPIPHVGRFNPTNNIIIGQDNTAAAFDILIGRGNVHDYMTEDNMAVREKLLTYTTKTPCTSDVESVAIGWNNYMSGNHNSLIGIKNEAIHTKGDVNMVGHNNQLYPQGYFTPKITTSAMPDGSIRSVRGGRTPNTGFSTPAMRSFANFFGIGNEISYEGGYLNIIGNYNSTDALSNSQIIGFDNYATGINIKVIGQYNLTSTSDTTVLGDNNFVQYGAGHKVFGNSNLLRNILFTSGTYPLNQMILGDFNTTNQTSYEAILGTNNLLNHTVGSYNTYIGNSNSTSKISKDNSLLGNSNSLFGQSSLVLGNQNRIDSDLFIGISSFKPTLNDGSALEDNVTVGNRNNLGSNSSLALGNDIYINQDNTVGIGNNAYTYNYGQMSYAALNLSDISSQDVNQINLGGITQKTSLVWRGISTGFTTHFGYAFNSATISGKGQEIYLNNTAYDQNHNQATRQNGGPSGRAYIPYNRIWNGTLNVTIADSRHSLVRSINKAFTVVNTGNSLVGGRLGIVQNTLSDNSFGVTSSGFNLLSEDPLFISGSYGRANNVGLMLSGDNTNSKLALWVTGLNNTKLHWNVSADFLDTFIPDAINDVPMLTQNIKSVVLL